MKKILLASVFFIVGVVLFMPKENLLYTIESVLKKSHVEIQSESLRDRLFDLKIKEPLVVYDGIESIMADSLVITPWILRNKIEAINVRPTKSLKSMLDLKADKVLITHSLLDYKRAHVEASGDFGEIEGDVDLVGRSIHLLLKPTKKFQNSQIAREYFKKSKEGLVYESKF